MPRIPPQHSSMPASIAAARGGDAVVVGVRRADRREHRAARFEIVVVAAHTRGGEALRLLVGEQPE